MSDTAFPPDGQHNPDGQADTLLEATAFAIEASDSDSLTRHGSRAEASLGDGQETPTGAPETQPTASDGSQIRPQSSFRGGSRAEACLEDSPVLDVVVPADLPTSLREPRHSDDVRGRIGVSFSNSRIESVRSEAVPLHPAVRVSLPASVDNASPRSSHWGELGDEEDADVDGLEQRRRSTQLLVLSPDSPEFVDEEAEVEKLSRSPQFVGEQAKDPGFTLLHFVAMLGNTILSEALGAGSRRVHHRFARVARCLVAQHQYKVYITDKYGCTPLQLAAACGNLEMVSVLLEPYGFKATGQRTLTPADSGYSYLNHQDDQMRFSALHGAVSHSQYDVVILLLKHGANPQVLDITRSTAFKVAPTLTSLQKLLRLVVRHEDQVPRPVIVQLMAEMLDSQGENQAAMMWSKAMKFVSFNTGDDSQRFEAIAFELMGNGHSTDVSTTIKRYFQQLYKHKRYDVILEYVLTSIKRNHGKLAEIMVDLICKECPHVLAAPRWHETLEPLVSSFPTLFHRLLFNLQDMRDQDLRGFVRCLSPAKFENNWDQRPQSAPATASQRIEQGAKSHAADRVKLLIYQQLVEGLKKLSYRVIKTFFEESDQKLLNDMAQFPIFGEFVGLVAVMQTAKAFDESDSSRQLLLEFLRPQGDEGSSLSPTAWRPNGTRTMAWPAHTSRVAASDRPAGPPVCSSKRHMTGAAAGEQWTRRSLQTLNVKRVLEAAVSAGKADNVEAAVMSIVSWVETNSRDNKAIFLSGISSDLIKTLATRFPSACAMLLNLVSREVLEQLSTLQVSASVLYNKEHLVKCSHVHNHFTWREQELHKLRLVEGYDDHVVDALVDYGVPFECVYKAAVEMGSMPGDFATPDHFAKLIEHKFSGPELKLLISNGIRLVKVIGYIEECSMPLPAGIPSEFKDKMDVPMDVLLRGMLGQRLNPRIVDIILRQEKMFETTKYNNFRPGCALCETYPEPLFVPKYTHHFVQMLLINWSRGVKNVKGKVIMEPWAKEFIDTIFEPNDPLCTKLKSAYDNKLTDTHVYIQGESPPDALDSPLSVELRKQQARQERQLALQKREHEFQEQLQHLRHLLRVFVSNYFLLHRWPVFAVAQLGVLLHAFGHRYWQQAEDFYYREKARRFGHQVDRANKARLGTIDAAVLVFPILGFFHLGKGDMLTALVDADAPSSWFHFAIVRALYTVHWNMFGRFMILLSAAVHLQFALVFLTFFLLVLNYKPVEAYQEDSDRLAKSPVIQGVLCSSAVLSASMLLERLMEPQVPPLATWVLFGRQVEMCCHAMVWAVAVIVWTGHGSNLVPALSGMTMLLFMARLTLFGLVTDKLSTAVLALLEILSDSKYFFLLIATVYGGFILAVAGLREETARAPSIYSARLFTVLLGDFSSTQLTDEDVVWRFPEFSLILLSIYAVVMLIIFMNLLIATMNDTYDRVKEFCEVEVMRLRAHMMVYSKDFMQRSARGQKLEPLKGEVLHLLLRPEAVKSSRLLPLGESEAGDGSAWVGRITYMRASIVREVEDVVRQHADTQLAAIERRLDQVGSSVSSGAADQLATMERRLERLEHGVAAVTAEQLAAIMQQLEKVSQGMAALAPRAEASWIGSPSGVGGRVDR